MLKRPFVAAACTAALLLPGAPAASALAAPAPTLQVHVTAPDGTDAVGVHVGWWSPDDLSTPKVHDATATGTGGTAAMPLPPAGVRYVLVAGVYDPQYPALTSPFGPAERAGTVVSYAGAGTGAASIDPRNITPYTTSAGGTRDLALLPAGTVSGTAPALAGRKVQLVTLGGRPSAAVAADAAGHWSMAVVPGRFRLVVTGNAKVVDVDQPVTVTAGGTTVVDPAQTPTGVLRGTATVAGEPAKNMLVRIDPAGARVVTHSPANGDGEVTATTDAHGRWSAPVLASGGYDVRYSRIATGANRSSQVPRTVHLADVRVARTTTLNTDLTKAAHLVGTFDTPASAKDWAFVVTKGTTTGAVVATGSGVAHSDTTGNTILVNGLGRGTYVVKAFVPGTTHYAQKVVHVATGATVRFGPLHPKLPALTVRGTVPGGAGGSVEFVSGGRTRDAAIDAAGRYAATRLLPADYVVRVFRDTTAGKSHDLVVTRSRTKDYASFGPAYVSATAAIDIRFDPATTGWPVHGDFIDYRGYPFILGISTDGRTASVPLIARAVPGSYEAAGLRSDEEGFQPGSPVDVVLPEALQHLTLRSGLNDLGAQHLTVSG